MSLSYLRGGALGLVLAGVSITAACAGKSTHEGDDPAAGGAGSSGSGGSGGLAGAGTGGKMGGSGAGGSSTSGGSGGGTTPRGGASGKAGVAGSSSRTCDDVRAEADIELENVQRCMTAADCGQVLIGTSCGCTHDLVARNDADVSRFEDLRQELIGGDQCLPYASACDCPSTDGFACNDGRCAWNYVVPGQCETTAISSLCVAGSPMNSGDALLEGMPLELLVRPGGCHSSSCTETVLACSVVADGDDFVVKADLCLAMPPGNVACTDDCGGGLAACSTEQKLTAGKHTVRLEGGDFPLSVTFTVPSVVTDGSLCDAMDE